MPSKKKILIGEDEQPLAKALTLKLERAGFEVTTASNGEEVIATAAKKGFDLILLDLIMPKMDGFTVLQQLKDTNNKIPVIVTSNLGQYEDIARAKSLGAIDYLVKSDTTLVKIVEYIQKTLA